MAELPSLPSDLITLALADLRKAESTPGLTIDMSDWYVTDREGVCTVCLAGAVMAVTLGISAPQPAHTILPSSERYVDPVFCDPLRALNLFRTGHIHDGLLYLDCPWPRPDGLPSRVSIAPYGSPAFYSDMEAMVALLRSHNL